MNGHLREFFRFFEGQPVEIFTDDGRVHCGVICHAHDNFVKLVDRCGRVQLILLCHIDSVVESQMHLRPRCKRECRCERECEEFDDHEEHECEHEHEHEKENGIEIRRRRY